MKTIEMTVANRRACEFRRWVTGETSAFGRRYSESSARQYVAQLRNYRRKLAPDGIIAAGVPDDLFELGDLLSFNTAVEEIRRTEGYEDFLVRNHRNFSAAVEMYRRFLANS